MAERIGTGNAPVPIFLAGSDGLEYLQVTQHEPQNGEQHDEHTTVPEEMQDEADNVHHDVQEIAQDDEDQHQ
jgi:hypothetical protein